MRTLLRANQLATLTVVIVATALLVAATGGGGGTRLRLRAPASSWEGLVGAPRPQVALGQRMIVVLAAPSLSAHLHHAGLAATKVDQQRWTAEAYEAQRAVVARLASAGVRVRPEYHYARTLNGFSAALDGRAVALLDADAAVAGVYPVRAAYPAEVSRQPATTLHGLDGWDGSLLPGFDGRGVTIAVLDTGVDSSHPWLRGHVAHGFDILGGTDSAEPRRRPGYPGELEEHGTETASMVVASAPGARLLPIRVAGWQQDANRAWAVFGRTDQVLAGLERAVDPNMDGDAADAVRVALVALAQPFAAFPDEPLARAAAGAARMGTLTVAPVGNDGPAAAVFGSVSGPGAAPAALTVGAADARPWAREVNVVLRTGLIVLLDRALPLAGTVVSKRPENLELVAIGGDPRAALSPEHFFDRNGYSLVAGRAVLMAGSGSVEGAVERAAHAGAAAVFLYGSGPPPGALSTAQDASIPVVTLPSGVGPQLAAAVRRGARVAVTVGPARIGANASVGRVASFSSRGLSFDGRLKPDLVAPGVGLLAAEPGFTNDGSPRSATVNGSSAAAAVAAGAVARLVQARPDLGAEAVKSVLIGSARPVRDDPLVAQGGGVLQVGAAAADEVASTPPTLAFGPVARAGVVPGTVVLRNVSTRRLTLFVSSGPRGRRRPASVTVSPARIELPAGESVDLHVRAVVRRLPSRLGVLQGALLASPVGGAAVRIPWTIGFRPARTPLLTGLRLSARRFAPSDTSPVVVAFQAGRVVAGAGGTSVQPVSRLDIELLDATERRISPLGLLTRLRDLLPGRYAVGLTGRDPHGKVLPKGRYLLRLVAYPTVRGPATRRSLEFTIVRNR